MHGAAARIQAGAAGKLPDGLKLMVPFRSRTLPLLLLQPALAAVIPRTRGAVDGQQPAVCCESASDRHGPGNQTGASDQARSGKGATSAVGERTTVHDHSHVAGQVAVADRVVYRAAGVDDEERRDIGGPRVGQ